MFRSFARAKKLVKKPRVSHFTKAFRRMSLSEFGIPPITRDNSSLIENRTITYKNGVYSGEVRMDTLQPHGEGMYKYVNYLGLVHYVYEGEFQNGIRVGRGSMTGTRQKDHYIGQWKDGHRHGSGRHETEMGYYEGEYFRGQSWGTGVYYSKNGSVYEGQWRDGMRCGKGVMRYGDGGCYEGDFKIDQRHGNGTMRFANGDEYKGEFYKNELRGQGAMHFANGTRHFGTFALGLLEGEGKIEYPSGDYYLGAVVNGTTRGQGVMHFANGRPPKRGVFFMDELLFDRKKRLYVPPPVVKLGTVPLKDKMLKHYLEDEYE